MVTGKVVHVAYFPITFWTKNVSKSNLYKILINLPFPFNGLLGRLRIRQIWEGVTIAGVFATVWDLSAQLSTQTVDEFRVELMLRIGQQSLRIGPSSA